MPSRDDRPARGPEASGAPERSRGRVAFVLPGGSTRGAVQVGMLLALTESSILPDLLVGTSVGALNAAVYAAAPDAASLLHLAHLWEVAPRSQIFPFSPLSMLKRAATRTGYLVANDGLRRWLETQTSFDRLEDSPIPLHVVTTEVATERAVVLSEGETVPSLLASSAIPGVFPPIELHGRLLCDGAIAADVPIAEAVALGASTLYVLPTRPDGSDDAARGEPAPTAAAAMRSTTSARARGFQLLDQLFGRPGTDERPTAFPGVLVHRLPAPPVADTNPFSFRASRRLVEEAYLLTRDWLAAATGAHTADPA
jgi:NTE family protein